MPIQEKPKLIVIVGPTSSGKSELAVRLAKKYNGEIISADSRQVYQELDIGTGKIPGTWTQDSPLTKGRHRGVLKPPLNPLLRKEGKMLFVYKNIPHYCIDFVAPKRQFSVAEFKQCAKEAIRDISSRGKLPILAGGTGLWIDAVIYDLQFPEVPPNSALRKKLEKKDQGDLLQMLKKLDPARANTIEQKNPRRLIRAIEIARAIGKTPALEDKRSPYHAIWLGIDVPKKTLSDRIKKRLEERIKSGMVREGKKLRAIGLTWKRFDQLGLEYRFLAQFLRGKITQKEMADSMLQANLDYARRQMVWFKKNKEIQWVTSFESGVQVLEAAFHPPRKENAS